VAQRIAGSDAAHCYIAEVGLINHNLQSLRDSSKPPKKAKGDKDFFNSTACVCHLF